MRLRLFGSHPFLPDAVIGQHLLEKFGISIARRKLVGVDGEGQAENGPVRLGGPGVDPAPVMARDEITGHQADSILLRAVAPRHKWVKEQAHRFC